MTSKKSTKATQAKKAAAKERAAKAAPKPRATAKKHAATTPRLRAASASAAPASSSSSSSSSGAQSQSLDDVFVSRFPKRERREATFYEPGDDAANSLKSVLDRPMSPAPPTPPNERRRARSTPARKADEPTTAARATTAAAALQTDTAPAPAPALAAAVPKPKRGRPPKTVTIVAPAEEPADPTSAPAAGASLPVVNATATPQHTLAVTRYVTDYTATVGVGFTLGAAAAAEGEKQKRPAATRSNPFEACGFRFNDGSCIMLDRANVVTYVNRHRHYFTLRGATASVSIPARLKDKFKALAWLRDLVHEHQRRAEAPADAAGADAPAAAAAEPPLAAAVRSAPLAWTMHEGTFVSVAPPPPLGVGPTFVVSADPAAGAGSDLCFVLSNACAPYPNATYYASDDEA